MVKKATLICTVLLNLFNLCSSQDIHFSQYNQVPLIINPAMTGVFNGDIRAIINYKDQWRSIAPYRTSALSVDMPLFKKKKQTGYMGAGLSIFNDKAGEFNWGITQFNLSASGIVAINDNQIISAGLQGGLAQRSINSSGLKWGNQFNGKEYDISIDPKENGDFSTSFYSDFAGGIYWSYGTAESSMTANDQIKVRSEEHTSELQSH